LIAYRAVQHDLISTVDCNETEFLPPGLVTAPCEEVAAVPALPPTASNADTPLIAIIDPRTLGRDSLALALQAAQSRFRNCAFTCLNEWLQAERISESTAVILLGVGATEADDPSLAEDLQFLAREFGHIATIVMGDIEAPAHVLGILAHGARGYIPTSVSLSVAVEAISLASAGGLFVPASCLMQHRQMPSEQPVPSVESLLTERQAAVAQAVARGKANKIIAYELHLCESTVKVHIRSIMKKLQARNRTEVAFKLHSVVSSRTRSAPGWPSSGRPAHREAPR
jgi:DNA-binding NarL/FixJ family response regulator